MLKHEIHTTHGLDLKRLHGDALENRSKELAQSLVFSHRQPTDRIVKIEHLHDSVALTFVSNNREEEEIVNFLDILNIVCFWVPDDHFTLIEAVVVVDFLALKGLPGDSHVRRHTDPLLDCEYLVVQLGSQRKLFLHVCKPVRFMFEVAFFGLLDVGNLLLLRLKCLRSTLLEIFVFGECNGEEKVGLVILEEDVDMFTVLVGFQESLEKLAEPLECGLFLCTPNYLCACLEALCKRMGIGQYNELL